MFKGLRGFRFFWGFYGFGKFRAAAGLRGLGAGL